MSTILSRALLCPDSKDNVPSDAIKSCPEMAGDMITRPKGSGPNSSWKSGNKCLVKKIIMLQFVRTNLLQTINISKDFSKR